MKKSILALALALSIPMANAEWVNQDVEVTDAQGTVTVVHEAYNVASMWVDTKGVIATSCTVGKNNLISIEWPVYFNEDVGSMSTQIFVDGRLWRDSVIWTVSGNRFLLISDDNKEAVNVMKRGKNMKIVVNDTDVKLSVMFDLSSFTSAYNTVKGKCQ